MNWMKWLKTLAPILSAILAALAARDVSVIQSGVIQDAGATEYGIVGLEGFGALAALVISVWSGFKSGKLSVTQGAETAAVVTLFAAFAAEGDKAGMTLASQIAEHIKQRADAATPSKAPLYQLVETAQAQARAEAEKALADVQAKLQSQLEGKP